MDIWDRTKISKLLIAPSASYFSVRSHPVGLLMVLTTNWILAWIEAYSKLVDKENEYFEKSINTSDKKSQKKYQQIADKYNEGINNLIKKLP